MFIARLFLQQAATQKKSAALLCGDLRKSYYSVLLEPVTGPMFTHEERQTIRVLLITYTTDDGAAVAGGGSGGGVLQRSRAPPLGGERGFGLWACPQSLNYSSLRFA